MCPLLYGHLVGLGQSYFNSDIMVNWDEVDLITAVREYGSCISHIGLNQPNFDPSQLGNRSADDNET